MKERLLLCCILLLAGPLNAQTTKLSWQQVTHIPTTEVYGLSNVNDALYAGAIDKIYFNGNNDWDSSQTLHSFTYGIEDVCAYNGRLFAGTYRTGVFVSDDNGKIWSQHNTGLQSNYATQFAIRNNTLYLATDDMGVYRYDAATSSWSHYSEGLAGAYVFYTMVNTDSGLIGGVGSNGVVVSRKDGSTQWAYSYLRGVPEAGLTIFDIEQAGAYIWAFTGLQAYASADQGQTWTHVGNGMRPVNSGKITAIGDTLFAAVNFKGDNTILYKRSVSAPLTDAWVSVDTLAGYATLDMAHHDGRLYIGTQRGLLYTRLYRSASVGDIVLHTGRYSVSPNPASQYITISNLRDTKGRTFQLYDQLGRQVLSHVLMQQQEPIHVGHLAAGMYYYNITHSSATEQSGNIIIAH